MFLFICFIISTSIRGFLFYSTGHNLSLSLFILMFSFVLDLAIRSSFKLAPVSFSSTCIILWAFQWIVLSLPHPWSQPFRQGCLVLFGWWQLEAKIWVLAVLNLQGCCFFEDFSMIGLTLAPLQVFTQNTFSWAFPSTLFKMATLDPSLATVYPSPLFEFFLITYYYIMPQVFLCTFYVPPQKILA